MFTGIVREVGEVLAVEGGADGVRVRLRAPAAAAAAAGGGGGARAGGCRTGAAVARGSRALGAVAETLSRTALSRLAAGDPVNVEPALRAGEPFGGHIVQGHVDGVGRVRAAAAEGDGARLTVAAPPEIMRYCVEKGSITLAGVSLTVAAIRDDAIEVALVPHTLRATTLGTLRPGDEVNLEADVLAKYVERALSLRSQPAG